MTQKNVSTGYVRKVMCKEVSSLSSAKTDSSKVQWYYRDDKNSFAAYSQPDSAKLKAYIKRLVEQEHIFRYSPDYTHLILKT